MTHMNRPVLLVLCILAVSSCTTPGFEYIDDMDQFMLENMAVLRAPAIAAGAVGQSGIEWQGNYGSQDRSDPVSEDTLFMLASVSKTFVVTAVLQLWERGLFELDDDINDHLDFYVRNPHNPDAPLTIRQILTHQSSIHDRKLFYMSGYTIGKGGGDSPVPLGDFVESYLSADGKHYQKANFNRYAPGEGYEYSNIAVACLAYLVEYVTDQDFAEYCSEQIFLPLGMNRTSWMLEDLEGEEIASPFSSGVFLKHYGYPDYPAGQIRTSVAQLASFVAMWMGDGSGNGNQILEPETVLLALTMQTANRGLIWAPVGQEGAGFWGHSGGDPGVSTMVIIHPEQNAGIIFLSNGDWRNSRAYDEIYQQLFSLCGVDFAF
jgi:CubicO group peptidase (beta-lactamase class C family)